MDGKLALYILIYTDFFWSCFSSSCCKDEILSIQLSETTTNRPERGIQTALKEMRRGGRLSSVKVMPVVLHSPADDGAAISNISNTTRWECDYDCAPRLPFFQRIVGSVERSDARL